MDKINSIYQQTFDFNKPLVFFPVRHHSVVCSYHLQQTIKEYQPNCILIEGPSNANSCIPYLVHENSKPPLSIYCSVKDKKGVLGEEEGIYHCYYPFLEYSPEFQALKLANKSGISSFFIDLPYGEYLAYTKKERENYNHDYLLAHSEYINRLCEKQKCRNFNELWEKFFELDGLNMSSQEFIKNLLTYCVYAREDYTQEMLENEGSLAREFAMFQALEEKKQKYDKILVVTGGFHVAGMLAFLNKELKYTLSKKSVESEAYVMAYSFKATDQLNGYASGMPYPAFYQNVWEQIKNPQPYMVALLSYIAICGQQSRKQKAVVSMADEIEAYQMAQGLKALREKPQTGVYELIDSIETAFIKTDRTLTQSTVKEVLEQILTGNGVGKLTREADVPPLVKDFYAHLELLSLQKSTAEHELALEIYKKKKHKKISEFFYQLLFLKAPFCEKLKGPDFIHKKDMSRIREIWKYQWQEEVERSLIEKSMYGGTLKEASTSLVSQILKERLQHAGKASSLIIESLLMGLQHTLEPILMNLSEIISHDGVFSSIAECLGNLHYIEQQELVTYEKQLIQINALLAFAYQRVISLMSGVSKIAVEEENNIISNLKEIYYLVFKQEALNEDLFIDQLVELNKTINVNSAIDGATCGLLYGMKKMNDEQVLKVAASYLFGTGDKFFKSSRFLKGLFATARDIILTNDDLINGISSFLEVLEEEKFLGLLPDMRIAFSFFTPQEIDTIGRRIADIFTGETNTSEQRSFNFTQEEGQKFNDDVMEQLREWGVK